jgi:hypothetical protein
MAGRSNTSRSSRHRFAQRPSAVSRSRSIHVDTDSDDDFPLPPSTSLARNLGVFSTDTAAPVARLTRAPSNLTARKRPRVSANLPRRAPVFRELSSFNLVDDNDDDVGWEDWHSMLDVQASNSRFDTFAGMDVDSDSSDSSDSFQFPVAIPSATATATAQPTLSLDRGQTIETAPELLSEAVGKVLEVFPDVDPDHLTALIKKDAPIYGYGAAEHVIHTLFEDVKYPRVDRKGKGKRKKDNEEDHSETKKSKVDYADKSRPFAGGPYYEELALVSHTLAATHRSFLTSSGRSNSRSTFL